jgi:hypothetical protein
MYVYHTYWIFPTAVVQAVGTGSFQRLLSKPLELDLSNGCCPSRCGQQPLELDLSNGLVQTRQVMVEMVKG